MDLTTIEAQEAVIANILEELGVTHEQELVDACDETLSKIDAAKKDVGRIMEELESKEQMLSGLKIDFARLFAARAKLEDLLEEKREELSKAKIELKGKTIALKVTKQGTIEVISGECEPDLAREEKIFEQLTELDEFDSVTLRVTHAVARLMSMTAGPNSQFEVASDLDGVMEAFTIASSALASA